MFRPEFCCCAIPLVNAGIYTLLVEQLVLGVAIGVLSIATPDIVGASVPSFTAWILAVICFIVAGLQALGFFGVFKEKTRLFRTYATLNGIAIAAAFSVAAALIIVSAVNHNKAVTDCMTDFYSSTSESTTPSLGQTAGKDVCNAFTWADVGIMSGLWLLLLVVQGYLIFMTRVYGNEQVEDHKRYHSVYSQNAEEYALTDRSSRYARGDEWDARPSFESVRDGPGPEQSYYDPQAQAQSQMQRSEPYAHAGVGAGHGYDDDYEYQQQQHQQQQQYPFAAPGGGYVSHPADARMAEEQQTPVLGHDQRQYHDGGLQRPEMGKSHPAEGLFGRKSPRVL